MDTADLLRDASDHFLRAAFYCQQARDTFGQDRVNCLASVLLESSKGMLKLADADTREQGADVALGILRDAQGVTRA